MMTTLKLWLGTIATTFTNIGALIIFAIIYGALVVSSYFFISTREATVWQVVVTYALMVVIPALFFLSQAAIIDRAREGKFRWGTILINAIKSFLAWLNRQGVPARDLEDLSQEVLLSVVKHLPGFQHSGQRGAFRAWLRTIVCSRTADYWRAIDNPRHRRNVERMRELQILDSPTPVG